MSKFKITTYSTDETHALGDTLGQWIEAGTVLAFFGDLGTGKTVLVQGLARGLGVSEDYYVTSPTYTLINEYPGRSRLFHMDLYRIAEAGDVEEIGFFDILQGDGVIAIEWAERLGRYLPPERLDIALKILDDEIRQIDFSACGQRAVNLLKKLKNFKTES
jgi:tRNA threonylcarbamoyladenosine biosynthesis protein TsaE